MPRAVLAQQAPAESEAGYTTTKTQTTAKPPYGWIGRKTTDSAHRVGNTEETDGNERTIVLTVGGFVRQCPTAEGIVAGNFEYSLKWDDVNTDEGEARQEHIERRIDATLEGHVLDDGTIDHVELDATLTIIRSGRFKPQNVRNLRVQQRFKPNNDGIPTEIQTMGEFAWDAPGDDSEVDVNANLLAAAIFFPSVTYNLARTDWMTPDTCVEVRFTPPSGELTLEPNASTEVRAAVVTKDGQMPVPATFPDARALTGGGRVTPSKFDAKAENTVTFSYTAPAVPKPDSGFSTEVVSRAGTARGEWRIGESALKLTLESHIQDLPATAGYGAPILDGTVRFNITLPKSPIWAGRFERTMNVERTMTASHADLICTGSASQNEEWDVRATLDRAAKAIHLSFASYPDDEEGTWTCLTRGNTVARADIDVEFSSEGGEVTLPATIGTMREFNIERSDRRRETFAVTVLDSPIK
jgi:hypothetical protein